jgi:hypothetical protein
MSENQTELGAEINIHFLSRHGMKPSEILIFQKVLICFNCGLAEFTISETQLNGLQKAAALRPRPVRQLL